MVPKTEASGTQEAKVSNPHWGKNKVETWEANRNVPTKIGAIHGGRERRTLDDRGWYMIIVNQV